MRSDDIAFLPLHELMARAAALRDRHYPGQITYSRKVFIPLTQLCRDVCHYCTFAQAPRKLHAAYLTGEQVLEIARAAAKRVQAKRPRYSRRAFRHRSSTR